MIDPTLAALWEVDALPLELGIALRAASGGQAETEVTIEPRHVNIHGICPVSYTHLDVYKRQHQE